MRIKSKWHDSSAKSIDDISGALAFILWRLTKNSLEDLINEGFVIEKEQVFAVILEYLCFSIQCIDRLAFTTLKDSDRRQLIITLVKQSAQYYQSNKSERITTGKYWQEFLDAYNERASDYANFNFVDGTPDYSFYRYFADKIKNATTVVDVKWIVQQMIEIQAPKAFRVIKKSFNDNLGAVNKITDDKPKIALTTREIRRQKRRANKNLGTIPTIKY